MLSRTGYSLKFSARILHHIPERKKSVLNNPEKGGIPDLQLEYTRTGIPAASMRCSFPSLVTS